MRSAPPDPAIRLDTFSTDFHSPGHGGYLLTIYTILVLNGILRGNAVPAHYVQPPWEFLLSASRNSLQSYELSRLSHAANLRKEMAALMDQWIEETSAAMLARWLMEHGEREAAETPAAAAIPERGHSVSDNFFADSARPHHASRAAT